MVWDFNLTINIKIMKRVGLTIIFIGILTLFKKTSYPTIGNENGSQQIFLLSFSIISIGFIILLINYYINRK